MLAHRNAYSLVGAMSALPLKADIAKRSARPRARDHSDINLFSYRQSIIDFDAEIPHRAFDLRMAKKKLHRT